MPRRGGIRVGRKRVERLMWASQLQGTFLRKRWRLGATRAIARRAHISYSRYRELHHIDPPRDGSDYLLP